MTHFGRESDVMLDLMTDTAERAAWPDQSDEARPLPGASVWRLGTFRVSYPPCPVLPAFA